MSAFAYIAVESCGCVSAITTDAGDGSTADMIAEWVRDGCSVERVTSEGAGERLQWDWPCPHGTAPD